MKKMGRNLGYIKMKREKKKLIFSFFQIVKLCRSKWGNIGNAMVAPPFYNAYHGINTKRFTTPTYGIKTKRFTTPTMESIPNVLQCLPRNKYQKYLVATIYVCSVASACSVFCRGHCKTGKQPWYYQNILSAFFVSFLCVIRPIIAQCLYHYLYLFAFPTITSTTTIPFPYINCVWKLFFLFAPYVLFSVESNSNYQNVAIIYLHNPWSHVPFFPLRNKSVHYVVYMVKLKLTSRGL